MSLKLYVKENSTPTTDLSKITFNHVFVENEGNTPITLYRVSVESTSDDFKIAPFEGTGTKSFTTNTIINPGAQIILKLEGSSTDLHRILSKGLVSINMEYE